MYDVLLAEMPAQPTDLLVLPHFAPTGRRITTMTARPDRRADAQTTRGEFIKGLLEGVTYYFRDGWSMAEAGITIDEYRATGAGRSDAWLQIKADILNRPLVRVRITEAGALGRQSWRASGRGVYYLGREAITTLVKIDASSSRTLTGCAYDERFANTICSIRLPVTVLN